MLLVLQVVICLFTAPSEGIMKDYKLFLMTPEKHFDNGCTEAALRMALADVANTPELLFNPYLNETYRFDPVIAEIQPNLTAPLVFMYYHIINQAPVVFIGPPFPLQQTDVGEMGTVTQLNSISYSEPFEPHSPYWRFYQTTSPSIIERFGTALRLMERYNWTKIAMINDYTAGHYQKTGNSFREKLVQNKIEILASEDMWSSTPLDVSKQVDNIHQKGARIIFLLASVKGARRIFCNAYHRQMFSPKIVWILFEILPPGWASDKYNSVDIISGRQVREIDCTEEELLTATKRYIAITRQGLRKDNVTTKYNVTPDEFRNRLKKQFPPNVRCNENTAYAYDAVWLMAFSFQSLLNLRKITTLRKLSDKDAFYKASDLLDASKSLRYESLTGPLSYKKSDTYNGREGLIAIWSVQNQMDEYVGTYNIQNYTLLMIPQAEEILFPAGVIPEVDIKSSTELLEVAPPLFFIMTTIAGIGIFLCLGFIGLCFFMMISCNHGNLSSLIFQILVAIGCMLCYASVIVNGLDIRYVSRDDTTKVCSAFLCLLSLGFALGYGSLFAKAWKIYKCYVIRELESSKGRLKTQKVPVWRPFFIVLFFVVIDVCVIGSWLKVSPFEIEIRNISTSDNFRSDLFVNEKVIGCTCKYETEYMIAIYCYKGIMLICGIFLTWQTSHTLKIVKKESKKIGMAMYNILVISIVCVICVSILDGTPKYEALYAVVSICVCVCTTTTLLLVFWPVLQMVYNSDGAMLENNVTQLQNGIYNLNRSSSSSSKERPPMKSGISSDTLSTQVSTDGFEMDVSSSYSPPFYGSGHNEFTVNRIDEEPEIEENEGE